MSIPGLGVRYDGLQGRASSRATPWSSTASRCGAEGRLAITGSVQPGRLLSPRVLISPFRQKRSEHWT